MRREACSDNTKSLNDAEKERDRTCKSIVHLQHSNSKKQMTDEKHVLCACVYVVCSCVWRR
jgi:hypothetical protein